MPRLSLEDSHPGDHGAEREQGLHLQSVICKTVLHLGVVDSSWSVYMRRRLWKLTDWQEGLVVRASEPGDFFPT